MFTNLKNKLFDEVKASPAKFQQLAQAAQAAVSSTSSNSESVPGTDNFFSITEEDTPQNSPLKTTIATNPSQQFQLPMITSNAQISPINNGNIINRSRKLSNSSIASDVSFRLPSYESAAVYHLQSDLDISASEHEDSSSSARLDLISKEQLHDAYRKALDRYQKYRSRYTDLAKRYRDLERDSTKARSVLVETQDKAIRRISELREQCTLEQQAKAHLEEALRMEMDDMQCKLKAYQTKLKLLGDSVDPVDLSLMKNLSDDQETLIKLEVEGNLLNLEPSNLEIKIQELESLLKEKISDIEKLNSTLDSSEKLIETLKKREEENSIILAQNKLDIHSELEGKESAIKKLTTKITELEKKYQNSETEKNQLKIQVTELNELKDKLKQTTESKQECQAKIISHDHMIRELKKNYDDKNKILEIAEEKIRKLTAEFDEKILQLKSQQTNLNSVTTQKNELEKDLQEVDQELNKIKSENNSLKDSLERDNAQKQKQIDELQNQLDETLKGIDLRKDGDDILKTEIQELNLKITDLTKSLKNELECRESNDNQIKMLETELTSLRALNDKTDSETMVALKESLRKTENDLNAEIKSLQDSVVNKETELNSSDNRIQQLQSDLDKMKSGKSSDKEKSALKTYKEKLKASEKNLTDFKNERKIYEDKMESEKLQLREEITNILQEISKMEETMKEVRSSHSELEEEKRLLESKIENMKQKNDASQEGSQRWQEQFNEAQTELQQVNKKLQLLESENSQLAEKNSRLQENTNHLEKELRENEMSTMKEKSNLNEAIKEAAEIQNSNLRLEYETANENIRKLNEKILQVLDENSKLQNRQELMEHNFRSLQDQSEAKEKEKLCVLDSNECLQKEIEDIQSKNVTLSLENTRLNEMATKLKTDLDTVNQTYQTGITELKKLKNDLQNAEKTKENLQTELKIVEDKLDKAVQNDSVNECKKLKIQLTSLNQQFVDEVGKLEKSYKENIANAEAEIVALKTKITTLQKDNSSIKDQNESFKKELDTLNNQNQARLAELENLLKETNDHNQTLQQSVLNATDFEKKLQNYEQLKIENEYLNKLTNQLETDIRKQKDDKQKSDEKFNQLNIKLNSQQCELYVLTECKEKHGTEMTEKVQEIERLRTEIADLMAKIETERNDNKVQLDHQNFVTQKNDTIQKELLLYQTKLQEAEKLCGETRTSYEQVITENIQLKSELELKKSSHQNAIDQNEKTLNELTTELNDIKLKLQKFENIKLENQQLNEKITELEVELADKISNVKKIEQITTALNDQQNNDTQNLRTLNEQLQNELEILKLKSSSEISNLQHEIDDLLINGKQLTDKLQLFDDLKEQAIKLTAELNKLKEDNEINGNNNNSIDDVDKISLRRERDDLNSELDKIMHEVQDVSNRNLFLEQKCENYLILEQSNERLKLANQKLSRQLDETLVSMQHNSEGIQANTEFEYLKNIMFQYLTGTVNGNNETLVKVIAAVLKFSPQQTQVAIEKEHQKHSLLGQFNNLL